MQYHGVVCVVGLPGRPWIFYLEPEEVSDTLGSDESLSSLNESGAVVGSDNRTGGIWPRGDRPRYDTSSAAQRQHDAK